MSNLPEAEMYEKSYMHRDVITQLCVTQQTDFLITASVDGHIKFWKKMPDDVEFVKHYHAHLGPVHDLQGSTNGQRLCSTSADKVNPFPNNYCMRILTLVPSIEYQVLRCPGV